MDNKRKIVAFDFDGTITEPEENAHLKTNFTLRAHAKEVLDWAYQNFWCILWTCRDDEPLQNALRFLDRNNIKFHSINENAPFVDFETSDKIFADQYIDDRSNNGIDWLQIKADLEDRFLKEPIDSEKIIKLVVDEAIQ